MPSPGCPDALIIPKEFRGRIRMVLTSFPGYTTGGRFIYRGDPFPASVVALRPFRLS